MLRLFAILFVWAFAFHACSQSGGKTLRFVPVLGVQHLQLDEPVVLSDGTPVAITQLRFYVSRIRIFSQNRTCYIDSASHLLDASEPGSLTMQLDIPRTTHVDSISFLLGIDSLTNVSGAMGGDLDPTKGMYWAWNSGYINWKLEGTCAKCNTAKNEFQYHLGGYLPPYYNAQRIGFSLPAKGPITVNVDLAAFLSQSKLGERCAIMSPSTEAVELARIAATAFTISTSDPTD